MRGMGNSSQVVSNQLEPSPLLAHMVDRHRRSQWKKPLSQPTVEQWNRIKPTIFAQLMSGSPMILDSGCGTGESSFQLTKLFPAAVVIGVDQSFLRLSRGVAHLRRAGVAFDSSLSVRSTDQLLECSDDRQLILLRGEVTTFWQLLLENNIRVDQHYLLYPNPWPRQNHLIRRWHGHPLFPQLPHLAKETILRTNWKIYAEEFSAGWELLGEPLPSLKKLKIEGDSLTPFEKKYRASNHDLWEVITPKQSCE